MLKKNIEKEIKIIDKELQKLKQKEIQLLEKTKKLFKDKKFEIVKDIYYRGRQRNLKGRQCILRPSLWNHEISFIATIYNKRSKKFDICDHYCYSLNCFKEIK
jgi:adenylate cyclase class IV